MGLAVMQEDKVVEGGCWETSFLAGLCWVACSLLVRFLSVSIIKQKRGYDFAVVFFCDVVVGTQRGTNENLLLGLGDLVMLG